MLQITDNKYAFRFGRREARKGNTFHGVLLFVGGMVIGIVLGVFLVPHTALRGTHGILSDAFIDMVQGTRGTPAAVIDLGRVSEESILASRPKAGTKSSSTPRAAKKDAVPRATGYISVVTNATPVVSHASSSETIILVAPRTSFVPAECAFAHGASPMHIVLLNEIAWMGDATSSSHEWIELRNNFGARLALHGWSIVNEDGDLKILFDAQDVIEEGKFFLLERTSDDAVLAVAADKMYAGALGNDGEWLKIFNDQCVLVDEVNASAGWKNFGGENDTKKTLERNVVSFDWHTSEDSGGTPRAQNDNRAPSAPQSVAVSPSTPQPTASPTPTSSASSSVPNTPSRVLLSEIFYDEKGSDVGKEFIELYNDGSTDVDLKDWSLQVNGSAVLKVGSKTEDKTIIPSYGYFLVGLNTYMGVPAADAGRAASLPNTSASLSFLDVSGNVADSMSYTASSTEGESLMRESWTSGTFIPNPIPTPQNSGR